MSEIPIVDMQFFKTMVSDGKTIFPMTTVEHEGKLWLVPQWIESKSEGWLAPLRIICLSNLPYQDLRKMPQRLSDFSLPSPIPRAVFDGTATQEELAGYTVVERPPMRFLKPERPN